MGASLSLHSPVYHTIARAACMRCIHHLMVYDHMRVVFFVWLTLATTPMEAVEARAVGRPGSAALASFLRFLPPLALDTAAAASLALDPTLTISLLPADMTVRSTAPLLDVAGPASFVLLLLPHHCGPAPVPHGPMPLTDPSAEGLLSLALLDVKVRTTLEAGCWCHGHRAA